ncbi:MAG: metal-sensing transcriptional repressor [Chloroflexi bacterium]|nr:metal-sensing transcriptional repressor [Chloroflexota bacterium]
MDSTRQDALKRLATIEGHLKGIRKMIEEDVYCVEILKQTYAVQRAIDRLEDALLQGHLSSCVPRGFAEGRQSEVTAELRELFELARR